MSEIPGVGSWHGELLSIHIATEASAPMQALDEAALIAGTGIAGDRYATGRGFYSKTPRPDRQVTLIEIETLEAIVRDHQIPIEPNETRRNLTVRGVPLNHLVGREFRVGECVLHGARLNVPCKYLDKLLGRTLFGPLTNRSGLNCLIICGGVIRPGDPIEPL
jgi:MOSC domain-containing protein YiiM